MPTSCAIIRHTVTYTSPGTIPPVFLAGSFTEPPWTAQRMECTQRADGEYVFTRRIHIAPGREYQFKFRKGDHDWVLDEDSRIVTDSLGNRNNVLCVDSKSTPKTTHHVPGKLLNELGIVTIDDRRSDTPIEQVASTAAEVADTAQIVDQVGQG